MRHSITLTIVLSLAAASVRAQQSPTVEREPWTLEQCVRYAVENSPRTNILSEQNGIRRQDYREAIARLLPSVNASVGARFNFGRNPGEDNTYVDASSFDNSYGIGSDLTVFAGMRNVNNIRLAKINREAGRHEFEQMRDEVAYATMEAFFNVLYYDKMVVLAASQLEESRLNLRQTERMAELGIKGQPDVAEMKAQEASGAYRLTEQQNMLAIGIILLKESMNFPVDEPFEPAPFDLDEPVAKTSETAAGLYEYSLSHLPKALGANSAARASEISLKIARGARYPTLSIDAGLSTGYYRNLKGEVDNIAFATQFTGKRGYYVGASLNIPIFNGLAVSSNVRRSKSQLGIARLERDATLRGVYTEIEQAVADMNGGADQYAQAVRQTEFTSIAHDVNRRKYEEGLVSALELHTSSNRLIQARADELYSRLTWILKKRLVDYYSGIPLIEPTNEN